MVEINSNITIAKKITFLLRNNKVLLKITYILKWLITWCKPFWTLDFIVLLLVSTWHTIYLVLVQHINKHWSELCITLKMFKLTLNTKNVKVLKPYMVFPCWLGWWQGYSHPYINWIFIAKGVILKQTRNNNW